MFVGNIESNNNCTALFKEKRETFTNLMSCFYSLSYSFFYGEDLII